MGTRSESCDSNTIRAIHFFIIYNNVSNGYRKV
jgi:hypothetical protein